MFQSTILGLLVLSLAMVSTTSAQDDAPEALNFKMKAIDGKEISLAEKYKDKAVVFVNVASRCGYTPQYKDLQAVYEKYKDQGLVVVGVPCNQFGGQEPGTNEEIAEFCEVNYGVKFDMLSKVDVKGDNQCELYEYLTSLDLQPKGKGPVKWNFEKIVIDKSGKPIARFPSSEKPSSDKFKEAIETALK